jgi:hypothetical protein
MISSDATGQLHYSTIEREGLAYRVFLPPRGLIVPERTAERELKRYLAIPKTLTPRIGELAERVTAGMQSPLEIARALEEHLRTKYRYDLASSSGAAEDPLDHFLFESKSGHCEFYSTAMAMMLRVRGVPSRNVTGFVGGTYNRFGEFYAVRQGDAHSWVEAYLPERGWIRFDPTPPSSAVPQARTQGAVALLREMFEAASQSWRQNVVGFDMQKQLSIVRSIRSAFRGVTGSDRPSRQRTGLPWQRLVLVAFGVGIIGLALRFLLRGRKAPQGSGGQQLSASSIRVIELYRRLDQALSVRGVARPLSTPPMTHARALLQAGHPTGAEAVELTRIYLDVRFAGQTLTEAQAREFAERVSALRNPPRQKAA